VAVQGFQCRVLCLLQATLPLKLCSNPFCFRYFINRVLPFMLRQAWTKILLFTLPT
jgi:hypothetical protein